MGLLLRAADMIDRERKATSAAISAARKILTSGNVMAPSTPVSKLSDQDLGWLFSAMLFAWLRVRAEQAAEKDKSDTDIVAAILPSLADGPFDWSKPLGEWRKEDMTNFLCRAVTLANHARAITEGNGERAAREVNAASGNPLVTASELNDGMPF
jgi:hypothetical protein